MYRLVVPAILEKYGVAYRSIAMAQKGYRNESYPIELESGETVNLLFYKRELGILERIQRADQVSEYVADLLPVRTRYDKRLLRIETPRGEVYVQLYRYLSGRTIAWEAYTKKHVKLLGWAMSDLHDCLAPLRVEWSTKQTIVAELGQIIDRMQRYLSDSAVQGAFQTKLGLEIDIMQLVAMQKLVAFCDQLPGQQVLHMDMVRGNVLFAQSKEDDIWRMDNIALTGIIDFEKTAYGHPLFDIARTIAFLLVDCEGKSPEKIYEYFLYSGYNKRGNTSLDVRTVFLGQSYATLLEGLVRLFLLYDFYKFLRYTPYESLEENHHYVRTRNILLDYAMIRYL
jgi:Ser/Thr protein kinase RdoA (MazF antagonist)